MTAQNGQVCLTDGIRAEWEWWAVRLSTTVFRWHMSHSCTQTVFTDASLDVIAYVTSRAAHHQLTAYAGEYICVQEAEAIEQAVRYEAQPSARVALYTDSTSCLHAFQKRSSSNATVNNLIASTHLHLHNLKSELELHYVNTHENIADPFTRYPFGYCQV